jgi:hypothetical protein
LDPGFRLRRPRDDIKKQNVLPDGAFLTLAIISNGAFLTLAIISNGAPFF